MAAKPEALLDWRWNQARDRCGMVKYDSVRTLMAQVTGCNSEQRQRRQRGQE